jgi:hypothetical protein
MNYHCKPNLDPKQHLTVDAVRLFQRFRQTADKRTVERLLDQELSRHLKLWELAIVHAANADMYWCDLPRHAIQDFDIWARRHLEKMGFEVEFSRTAQEETLASRLDSKKTINTVVAHSRLTAKWLLAKPRRKKTMAAEWRRRERLEAEDLKQNPPRRLSRRTAGDLDGGNSVWAAVLDGKFIVEVQRRNKGALLCLFGLDGKCLHVEPTSLSYGALFGPDVSDVAGWESRAQRVVDGWQATKQGGAKSRKTN